MHSLTRSVFPLLYATLTLAAPGSAQPAAEGRWNLSTASVEFSLRTADGQTVLVRRTAFEEAPGGAITWWGEVEDGGQVVLTQVGAARAGTLFRAGETQILDAERWIPLPAPELASCGVQLAAGLDRPPLSALPSEKVTAVVDLLVLYTSPALGRAGNVDRMEADVRQEVAIANQAYRNSGVDTRLRLVGLEPLAFAESGSNERDAPRLGADLTAQALRRQYGADVVGLIVGQATDFCGYAFTVGNLSKPHAYFVEHFNCLRGLPTLTAHEIGHLHQLDHNPENAVLGSAVPGDAHGHWYDGRYRTVMSYRDPCTAGCPAEPFFSNPSVHHQGLPTGLEGTRNNARVLRANVAAVAGFETLQAKPPLAPTELTAQVREPTGGGDDALEVVLRWRDNANNERHFLLYRSADGDPERFLQRLSANAQSTVDTGVELGRRYRYRLVASNILGDTSSETVDVDTALLTAEPRLLTAEPRAGELVRFALDVTGPARQARWVFGEEGVNDAVGLAVSDPSSDWRAGHLFPRPGIYPVKIAVTGAGRRVEAGLEVTVGGEEPAWDRSESRLQSVIHGPRGGGGTFRSHLWLHNGGPQPALVDLGFLPRGLDNTHFLRHGVALEAGRTLRLEDVVALLGEEGTGALLLATRGVETAGQAPRIHAFARSFVESTGAEPGASFGQRVPEEPEAGWSAEPRWIPGLLHKGGSGFTTSLQGTNLEDRPGRLTLTLTDAVGTVVGEAALALAAHGNRLRRLDQLFPTLQAEIGAFQPPFTARVSGNGIRFTAAGILLDDGSEDQAFLVAQTAPPEGLAEWILPRVVRGPGQFEVTLSTRLVLHNPAAEVRRVTVELLERGRDNSSPRQATLDLLAGETRVVEDVLADLFAVEVGAGALVVRWDPEAALLAPQVVALVQARTVDGLRFATTVPALDPGAAGSASLDFGAEQSTAFQAAFGILNLAPGPTRVELRLRDAFGAELSRRELTLKPRQHLERLLQGLFDDFSGGENLVVETHALSGGPVLTYLVNINRSGDLFFVPGLPRAVRSAVG